MQSFTAEGGVILVDPSPGWSATLLGGPGSYAVVFTDDQGSIEGRRAGLELRDTILVLSEGPTSRYAFLFRTPLTETTVADQMTQTRTGALNIKECRIVGMESTQRQNKAEMGFHGGNLAQSYATGSTTGRWPPNVLLVHGPDCRNTGTKRVKSSQLNQVIARSNSHSTSIGKQTDSFASGYADAEGLETVVAWKCSGGCPVKILDGQTGERPSTLTGRADPEKLHENPGDNHGSSLFGGGNSNVYADSGGGSRFYPQFKNNEELFEWLKRLLQ
jgi:hypothetical protein